MFFLQRLARAFDRHDVDYRLVGGYAVALHGAVRGTMDIDVVVALSLSSFERAEQALRTLGLVSRLPVSAADVFHFRREYLEKRNLVAWSFYHPERPQDSVDIVLTHDAAQIGVERFLLKGTRLKVAALPDLIRMKSATRREQDRADAAALNRIAELRESKP